MKCQMSNVECQCQGPTLGESQGERSSMVWYMVWYGMVWFLFLSQPQCVESVSHRHMWV